MTQPLVIGLDCGTGGARAMVVDLTGQVRGHHAVSYETHFPQPGWAEQSSADWWAAAATAVRGAVQAAGADPSAILAIAASGTSSTVVALDAAGSPIGPAILWMDNRASGQARRMSATGDTALARSRKGVSSETQIPKLLWLKERQPDTFGRARWFVEMSDYLAFRLSGRLTLGLNAITNRWFYDGRTGGWPTAFYDRIGLAGITERFPSEILPLGTPVGPLAPEAVEAMGLSPETLVVMGGTDAYVAMLGLDVCAPGKTGLITGSSHLLLCQTDQDSEAPGLFGPHPDCVIPGLSVFEGGQVSSLSIVKWWHDHVGHALHAGPDSYAAMMRQAADVPIGADGLVALDFWQGNRNPYTDYDLTGALWGLTLRHTPAHMLRAMLEAICFGTQNIVATLAENGIPVTGMAACGGATRNPFVMQMHADVTGLPITLPKVTEATGLGAAILAAVGAGSFGSLAAAASAMVSEDAVVEPNQQAHARYSENFDLYRQTYAALMPLMHEQAARRAALQGVIVPSPST